MEVQGPVDFSCRGQQILARDRFEAQGAIRIVVETHGETSHTGSFEETWHFDLGLSIMGLGLGLLSLDHWPTQAQNALKVTSRTSQRRTQVKGWYEGG